MAVIGANVELGDYVKMAPLSVIGEGLVLERIRSLDPMYLFPMLLLATMSILNQGHGLAKAALAFSWILVIWEAMFLFLNWAVL